MQQTLAQVFPNSLSKPFIEEKVDEVEGSADKSVGDEDLDIFDH